MLLVLGQFALVLNRIEKVWSELIFTNLAGWANQCQSLKINPLHMGVVLAIQVGRIWCPGRDLNPHFLSENGF